jgi:hypothetical protein
MIDSNFSTNALHKCCSLAAADMCQNNTYAYCKQVKLLSSLQEIVDIDSIPTQLGGTSDAVIGVHDPMWKEIDHVMAELAAADHKRLVSSNFF